MPSEWSDADRDAVVRLFCERTGFRVANGCGPELAARIDRVRRRAGLADAAAYLDALRGRPGCFDDLLDELLIGETYFFRDAVYFDFVRTAILPALLQQREPATAVRVWSAGCSSGEEVYSLAILFEQEGVGDRVTLLGTDLGPSALARARAGVYGPWSFRGAAGNLLPYLESVPGTRKPLFRVKDALRRRVEFRRLNLAHDEFPDPDRNLAEVDLILCRNVLLYLDAPVIARVVRRLYASLAPGGWLIAGPSDPPLNELAPLHTTAAPWGVYRRPADPAAALPVPPDDPPTRSARQPGAAALEPAAPWIRRASLLAVLTRIGQLVP